MVLINCIICHQRLKLVDHFPKKSQNIATKLKIHCELEQGNKPVQFEWHKNGIPLPSSGNGYRIESSEEDSLLVVDKVTISDSGASFTCYAKNHAGEKDSQTTTITVKG